jgi:uncharacterized alpha-E superfamily protein
MGLVRSTMLHEEPMSFLWLGAMLERCAQTARILDMHHHTMEREAAHEVVQVALWMSLLRACSGSEAFMKKKGRVSAHNMVAFLLFEPAFPRSLAYSLQSSQGLLKRIWGEPAAGELTPQSISQMNDLVAWLARQSKELDLGQMHKLLTHVVDETTAICSHISREIQGPPRGTSSKSTVAPGTERMDLRSES